MTRYKNAHLWLIIPFAIVLLGFAPTYWARLFDAPWRHHLHGLTATLWFCLLVLQPYFITRGRPETHRRFGLIALVVAGGVALSAASVIPYNLVNERMPEVARYGLSFVDVVLLSGFVFAVLKAATSTNRLEDHARWMIATAFWAVSPGLFRLLLIPVFISGNPEAARLMPLLLAAAGVLPALALVVMMVRERRAHPAYLSAAFGSLVMLLPIPVGSAGWWRAIADAVFTI